MKIVAFIILLSGLTILATSLPLLLRKVPMNRKWGIRLPAAFESDQRWYEINAYGGRLFAVWSLLIVGTGLVGFFLPNEAIIPYAGSATAISFVSVVIPLVRTCAWIAPHKKRQISA